MTSTSAETTQDSPRSTKAAPPAWKPPTLVNKRPAPFWFDDSYAGQLELPHKGMALRNPVELTEAQWKRRTPQAWGVLLANDRISLVNVPAKDAEAVLAAQAKEEERLAKAKIYSDMERSIMKGAHKI